MKGIIMEKKIYQMYDKVMKKSLTLSKTAVINFLNGCFHENYPLDSTITYNWTEHVDDELKRTIADGIITINNEKSYHVEAQIDEDEEMQFRVFDYGYKYALTSRNGKNILHFPEPVIIYLYKNGRTPDVQSISIDFGSQGTFEYKVKTFKLLEHELDELNQRKMLILLPFMIMKFREEFEKRRTKENMNALKNFIVNDILNVIDENVKAGNLTLADAGRMRNLMAVLYRHLFAGYEECQKEGINDMVEEGLVLEMDIIEQKHKKEIEGLVLEMDVIEQKHKKEIEGLVHAKDTIEKEHKKEIEGLVHEKDTIEKEHKKEIQGLVHEKDAIEKENKKKIEDVTANIIMNAYRSIHDISQVAIILGMPEEEVRNVVEKVNESSLLKERGEISE
jgi:hypothetical protein